MSRFSLVEVEFTEDIYLPRFNMKRGSRWMKRADRIGVDGFRIGGGFVNAQNYTIIGADNEDQGNNLAAPS